MNSCWCCESAKRCQKYGTPNCADCEPDMGIMQEAADAMQAQAAADEYDSRMLFEEGLHD